MSNEAPNQMEMDALLAFFFIGFEDHNLFGWAESTNEGYKLTFRFRYYVDDKNHDSDDIKHWYGTEIKTETSVEYLGHKLTEFLDEVEATANKHEPRKVVERHLEVLKDDMTPQDLFDAMALWDCSHVETHTTH